MTLDFLNLVEKETGKQFQAVYMNEKNFEDVRSCIENRYEGSQMVSKTDGGAVRFKKGRLVLLLYFGDYLILGESEVVESIQPTNLYKKYEKKGFGLVADGPWVTGWSVELHDENKVCEDVTEDPEKLTGWISYFRKKDFRYFLAQKVTMENYIDVHLYLEQNYGGLFDSLPVLDGVSPVPEKGVSINPENGRMVVVTKNGLKEVEPESYIVVDSSCVEDICSELELNENFSRVIDSSLTIGFVDEKSSETDDINHPSHYTWIPSGLEVIELTEWMNFNLGNAVKYIARAGRKGDSVEDTVRDLSKAQWYISREIERVKQYGNVQG